MDLPSLMIPYSKFSGSWESFIEELYKVFERDFITDMPIFKGHQVDFGDKRKLESNKEETFWHLTSRDYKILVKGAMIKDRKPDFYRAERIAWIREIIENSGEPSILVWVDPETYKTPRYHLWYNQEFMVVMNDLDRFKRYVLITSFCTKSAGEKSHYMGEYARWK